MLQGKEPLERWTIDMVGLIDDHRFYLDEQTVIDDEYGEYNQVAVYKVKVGEDNHEEQWTIVLIEHSTQVETFGFQTWPCAGKTFHRCIDLKRKVNQ